MAAIKAPVRMARPTDVEVKPFHDRFSELAARDGLTHSQLACRMGWYDHRGYPDGQRIRRTFGLQTYYSDGIVRIKRWVRYETAVRLAEALELDPYEVGL